MLLTFEPHHPAGTVPQQRNPTDHVSKEKGSRLPLSFAIITTSCALFSGKVKSEVSIDWPKLIN